MFLDILSPGIAGSLDPQPGQDAFRLPATDGAVGEARHRVRAALRAWGATPRCDDMALVVSELFTNAVRHTDSEWIDVVLRSNAHLLYVEVTDQGDPSRDVAARKADAEDEGGRGLMLVEHLAVSWGAGRQRGGGNTVWAILSRLA